MSVGDQIFAPKGLTGVAPGERLHVLRRDDGLERVLLVSFSMNKREVPQQPSSGQRAKNKGQKKRVVRVDYKYKLIALQTGTYEEAISNGELKFYGNEQLNDYPSWLDYMEGKTPSQDQRFTSQATKDGVTPEKSIDKRLLLLHEAINAAGKILRARDPDRELNKFARACNPPQCEIRFRLWFYLYIAYGHKWVLLAPNGGRGIYDRTSNEYEHSKFGKSLPLSCRMTQECIAKIFAGYDAHQKPGVSFSEVFRLTLVNQFKVTPRNLSNAKEGFYHPGGESFPTYDQFRYQIKLHHGKLDMLRHRKGNQRYRSEDAPVQGQYSEFLVNMFQTIHADARQVNAHPKSMLGDHLMQKLWVVDLFDGLGGYGGGIGFSVGGERSDAYRRAIFCHAIPKSKFGEIIGYPIRDEQWPCHGLPLTFLSDRGPGSSKEITRRLDAMHISHGMTPSWSPQSNTRAESMHPKSMKKKGAPEHVVSNLNVIQMTHKAVEELLLSNRTSSSMAVASNGMVARNVRTKHDFFLDMKKRLRIDLRQIPFEMAVRTLLDPIELQITDGVLKYKGTPYSSDQWKTSKLFENSRHVSGKHAIVKGYILHPFTKIIWLELEEGLTEVSIRKTFRDGEKNVYVSSTELELIGKARSTTKYQLSQERRVALTSSELTFERNTGRKMYGGVTKKGRAITKTVAALKEGRELEH